MNELAFQRGDQLTSMTDKENAHFLIVILYRDRKSDLLTFLVYVPIYFCLQGARMDILVNEQAAGASCNKGKLFNAAIREMDKISAECDTRSRLFGYNCFSFHGTDKLPIHHSSRFALCLPFGSPQSRSRMSAHQCPIRISRSYSSYLGGATMLIRDRLELMNGSSTSYFDWGGEDDDAWNRALMAKLPVFRLPYEKGRFTELGLDHKLIINPRLASSSGLIYHD
ncbi:hypothetical protein Aperf_G00000053779 [Anoplocephala perfoliata]